MVAKEQKLARRHNKEDKIYEDGGLENALKTYQGRRFIWWLLGVSGLFQNPYNNNALATAFASGKMEIGQTLLARVLEVNDEAYITMMRENQELQMKRREELAAAKGEELEEFS